MRGRRKSGAFPTGGQESASRGTPPRQIAVYGKGGIGKSTTVANLAVLYGMAGHKVLLVGCDPKHDTSYRVTEVRPVPTVLGALQQKNVHDLTSDDFLVAGRHGVTCIEAGGPEPGVGCAGRGLSKMFEMFDTLGLLDREYDTIIYDVLGDVVCGGFAVPMRRGYAAEVFIVASGETMALYAANNICRALVRLQGNGVRLAGVIGNLRGLLDERAIIEAFAERIGSRVLHHIPRDEEILRAERERRTVVEYAPESPATAEYRALFEAVTALDPNAGVVPRAMGELGFEEFIREQVFFFRDGLKPPAPPVEGFNPALFRRWLGRALTSKLVRCRQVRFSPDGRLLLDLASRSESALLALGPRAASTNPGVHVEVLDGIISPNGEAHPAALPLARYAASRLGQIAAKFHVPLFDLFRLDSPTEVFTFESGLFAWRLGQFLVPGVTRSGPFVYAGEQFDGEALRYRFESARANLVLRLEMGAGRSGAAYSTRHLSLTVEEDERAPAETDDPDCRVEHYLAFLLALSDPPEARYAFRHRTEGVVVGSTQDWGADLRLQFFADPGFDFLANFNTAFGLGWRVGLLYHGERECSHMATYVPAPMQNIVPHPLHVTAPPGMSGRVFVSDLTEADSALGGEDRLLAALRAVAARPDIEALIVQDTCVVRVMGDDIRRCIREVEREVAKPIFYLDATAMDESAPLQPIIEFWRELISRTAAQKSRARGVNLVGYGRAGDPTLTELEALLAAFDVPVNAVLFPTLLREHALCFRDAAANVVSPFEYVRVAFSGIASWAEIPTFVPPAPYGERGTAAWLTSLLGSLGREPPGAEELAPREETRARLAEIRTRAADLEAGVVVVSTQSKRLLEAERLLGVPLLPMLADLGLRIRVLFYDPPRVRELPERLSREEFMKAASALPGLPGKLAVEPLEEPEDLPRRLAEEAPHLIYSEIRDDPRLRAAGKGQFSVNDLEAGFTGAVRTAERLIRRAAPPLTRRYQRFLVPNEERR